MTQPAKFFDRALVARRRDRAAKQYAQVDFLKRDACERLVDKLLDIKQSFARVVDVGAHQGQLGGAMRAGGLDYAPMLACDLSLQMMSSVKDAAVVVADEEWLPLADDSVDLIVSAMSLHLANDLVGVLIQMRRALRSGGLMMANLVGGQSLYELRQCLAQAESELYGGVSPRVMPMLDVRDAGDLLARAGFALPVADSDVLSVSYPDMWAVLRDLRQMGGANMLAMRPRMGAQRRLFARAAELYQEQFGDGTGRVNATIEWVSMTGWRD